MSILRNGKVRTLAVYLLALILICAALAILNPGDGGWAPGRLAGAMGLIALILLPLVFLANRWRKLIEASEVFRLEERILEREDLDEAVRLWVYARDKEQIEGEILYETGEDGEILCRYYLRQN